MQAIAEGSKVKILDTIGNVRSGYIVKSMSGEYSKSPLLLNQSTKDSIFVNKDRILPDNDNHKFEYRHPKPKQQKKHDILDSMVGYGELWAGQEIAFNQNVMSRPCCLIVEDLGRYISFNTYNGSIGKNGTHPYQRCIDGLGYKIGDISKLRARLKTNGYQQLHI